MLRTKKPEEIEKLKIGGKILAKILDALVRLVKPGIATFELEKAAQEFIKEAKCKPSFLWYNGYPAALCVSVNEVVVHGLPSERVLKDGDIISLDLGLWYEGLAVDAALTVPVGKISKEAKNLINATREALRVAIKKTKAGIKTGDLGFFIEESITKNGFKVVRELVGHGVGYEVHEEPQIPNFGTPGSGVVLPKNLVIALEPMAAVGSADIKLDDDGFGYKTKDASLSAHFEVTVAVTPKGSDVLTPINI
ncbi:type I methionyl aminopeptidase [Candidatus Parcubacteria bacterium]|nr:MAG: type I methionyl aminopeptidase [Candidatus Parcubacteria bacterium]